ncbi:MAG: hypothetical protein RG740_06670, partial [Acholeplasmataceae bacterium]|nr:hypothetical protein [Acholeplasmataceae bacterium]
MFELIVALSIYAFWFSLIIGSLTLFLIRLYIVIIKKLDFKKASMILWIPCSIGFYLNIKEESQLTKIYKSLVIIFFVSTFIASLFILYIHLELN